MSRSLGYKTRPSLTQQFPITENKVKLPFLLSHFPNFTETRRALLQWHYVDSKVDCWISTPAYCYNIRKKLESHPALQGENLTVSIILVDVLISGCSTKGKAKKMHFLVSSRSIFEILLIWQCPISGFDVLRLYDNMASSSLINSVSHD